MHREKTKKFYSIMHVKGRWMRDGARVFWRGREWPNVRRDGRRRLAGNWREVMTPTGPRTRFPCGHVDLLTMIFGAALFEVGPRSRLCYMRAPVVRQAGIYPSDLPADGPKVIHGHASLRQQAE